MGIQIDRLSFVNYRQYGTCEINFKKSEKADTQLFAIIAQNGTGKTTVLKAITWCLYGKENPRESNAKTEARSLPLINTHVLENAKDGEKIPVSVSFRFVTEEQNIIEFTRSVFYMKHAHADPTNSASAFTASVTPHDNSNTKISYDEDAAVLVKQYFDEAIYNFYFFDGEKLKDFFATPLKASIYNIAQVNLLEDTIKTITGRRNKLNKAIGIKIPAYAQLHQELMDKEDWIEKTEKEIERTKERLTFAKGKEKEYSQKLMGYHEVEPLQKERKKLEQEAAEIEKDELANNREKMGFIKTYLPLLLMYPRIKKIYQYISEKSAEGKLPPKIDRDQICELLKHKDQPCPLCHSHLTPEALLYLEKILRDNAISSNTSNFLSRMMSPLETAIDKVQKYEMRRDELRIRERNTEQHKRKNEAELKEVSQKLNVYGGEAGTANVAEWNKAYEKAKEEVVNYSADIKNFERMISSKKEDIERLEKQLEECEKKQNFQEQQRKELQALKKMSDGFTKVREAIVDETKREMQEQTWKEFRSMIWKENTFGSISIDDQYNVAVYNMQGHIMTDSASATEAMALAYAFTLSVHQVSGKNCPLVIDSPLGRVSDENRVRMAKALLNIAKEKQIIMLFTPDEYSPAVAEMYDKKATVRHLNLSKDESVVEGVDR